MKSGVESSLMHGNTRKKACVVHIPMALSLTLVPPLQQSLTNSATVKHKPVLYSSRAVAVGHNNTKKQSCTALKVEVREECNSRMPFCHR